MAEINKTKRASLLFDDALECCKGYRHEFLMPEHMLVALMKQESFRLPLTLFYGDQLFSDRLDEFLAGVESVPEGVEYEPDLSAQMTNLIEHAFQEVALSGAESLDIPHLIHAIFQLKDSWACYLMKDSLNGKEAEFMREIIDAYEFDLEYMKAFGENDDDDDFDEFDDFWEEDEESPATMPAWKKLVSCMNDLYQHHNPLIGREAELQRTVQVLCRLEKNNPLFVGEPGVGKTALVWGLARMVEEGHVPNRLKGSRIYQLDVGSLLAGTQFRGDFESRLKQIMDGIQEEGANNIVYIDEIHTLVGAGATGEGAMDASNMLKPYLEAGRIRFVGSTTYEEYNRHFARSKGFIRRFQQIDIAEPSIEETKRIISQLLPRYEEFHGVKFDDEAVAFAVEASAKHINDRFLPDKAIDLIDEAGAAKEAAPQLLSEADMGFADNAEQVPSVAEMGIVTKADIADVLAKTCKVDALAEAADDDYQQLESLASRMLAQIYGQDEAIRQVVEAVQMSRAGLLDDNKPLASLLFVGPTGVGKTEVARVLARELGIELTRFDMSEYTEKHAVAKLIGSPAGYVGYEDGGLLTDAIRKSPNCVLLLDEIEKAHQDIYNILLQVMDYARLTDNKGRHADFRNVILIMTSNAGAQYASQGSIGFNSSVTRGQAMMAQVKKTFKPEFLNRLSGSVVFRDMDKPMATLILKKKLKELDAKLAARNVTMALTPEAMDYLLREGFTPEYGAREMDRVIAQRLKPILMHEILFGSLKQGGNINIGVQNGSLYIG